SNASLSAITVMASVRVITSPYHDSRAQSSASGPSLLSCNPAGKRKQFTNTIGFLVFKALPKRNQLIDRRWRQRAREATPDFDEMFSVRNRFRPPGATRPFATLVDARSIIEFDVEIDIAAGVVFGRDVRRHGDRDLAQKCLHVGPHEAFVGE